MAQRNDDSRSFVGQLRVGAVDVDVPVTEVSAPDDVPGRTARPDPTASSDVGLTPQQMQADVARDLAVPPTDLAPDDDLVGHGLDSMRIMQLVGQWRRRGVRLRFADLVERPTLEHWWDVLAAADPGHTHADDPDADADDPEVEVDETRPFPLTPMQHAYWIGRRDDQVLGGVGCHFYVEFDGDATTPVDPARLDEAVRAVLRRHGLLRARFLDDGTQQIDSESTWPGLTVHDLRDAPDADAERHLAEQREALAHRRLDVARGEVFDVRITLLPGGRHRLHVNFDLLVADVLSIQIILEDLTRFYADGPDARLPELDYGFPTYLLRRQRRREQARDRAREYWRSRIPTMPTAPQLPLSTPPEQVGASRFRRRDHLLDAAARHRFEEVCRQYAVTPSVVLAAAYAEVLGAWSTNQRFLLSLPLFDREITDPHVGRIVADFTNLVPLEVDVTEPVPFVERVRALQTRLRTDVGHSEYAGVEVLRDLTRSRPDDRHPATVVFTSAIGMGDLVGRDVQEVFGRLGWMLSQTPQVWLDHQVVERDGGVSLVWDAVEELFAPGVLDAMFGAYVGLLEWLVEGDWSEVVPGLLPVEQRVVRAGVNATGGPVVSGRLLHEGFFGCAVSAPERVALLWDGGEMSYGDLADRALRIAGALRERGVGAGDRVAVTLPKGPDQVAAVLGVLAAGAAYVPVGVDQPTLRRASIFGQAEVRWVLTDDADQDWPAGVRPLTVADATGATASTEPVSVPPEATAYVIFTSGSTGEPKGVVVSHGAAVNTVVDVCGRFGVGEGDRVLAVSALDFDLSVFDVFGLLGVGGGVVLVGEGDRRDPYCWLDLCGRFGVSVWNSVPALLDMVLVAAGGGGSGLSGLRVVLVSGDWVGLDLPGRVRGVVGSSVRFVALGGATEAAVWSNWCEVGEVPDWWSSVPYGVPLSGQRFRVVDGRGRDCPDWVAGELWIGGVGVASGYCNDVVRTGERFVGFAGERWYRTGDVGRYWSDGTLEFLGRTDDQVKVRGHRIELGEVESALVAFGSVVSAVVLAVGDPLRLVAFVVPGEGADVDGLADFLGERLPSYAVPSVCVVLDELPLTVNGKVDRRVLVGLVDEDGPVVEGEPVRGEVEERVAAIWVELLGVAEVRRDDNFIALGGDSLLATRLISRLHAEGYPDAELGRLFADPELAGFAAGLRRRDTAPTTPQLTADPEHRYDPFPPTDVQRAYWIGRTDTFALGGVGCHFYTEYDGRDVDLDRLTEALDTLVDRHEMLRARFLPDGDQQILPEVPRFEIRTVDAAPGEDETELQAQRDAMSHQVLDPGRWPLFDVRAVRYGDRRVRLAVSIDSILIDALSAMILMRELDTLYRRPDADLPPIGLSFRDYVLTAQPDPQRLDASRRYWSQRVEVLPDGPQLPLAVDPADVKQPRFVRREQHLPQPQWQRLRDQARRHGITGSALLATAFAEVLGAWSAQPDLTVNVTLFDRRDVHPDVDRVLGDFTSLLLVGYRPEPQESWLDATRRMQRQMGRDLEHSDVSAVWVMRELARRRGRLDVSMPVVFTSTLGVTDDVVVEPSFAERVWGVSQTPQVWLDHQVVERDGGVSLVWDAVEELFAPGVLDAMFGAYVGLLEWLVEGDWSEVVPGLLPVEQRVVRAGVNATGGPVVSGRLLHEGFFGCAVSAPERVALLWDGGEMSYGDLADRALRVAGLLAARGVRPGDTVAVHLPKGPDQVAAVLGVLAAGAAYVPVGVDQPPARRDRIYRAAEVGLVLDDLTDADAHPPLDAPVTVDPDSRAYVIFTSGSTGEPKGVVVSHGAAVNTVVDVCGRFGVGEGDRVLAVSALDFDLSVFDVFGLLGVGGGVVLVGEGDRRDPYCWLDLCGRFGVSVWNSVPALLDMVLVAAGGGGSGLSGLRVVLVSGDWVGLDLPGRVRGVVGSSVRFVALGGATEAAVWSNWCEVGEVPDWWSSVPYGVPLSGQRFRVVDGRGRDCPDWVAGELWIGGVGVASGYCNDVVRTGERFVGFAGERWYRTGDVGRYWSDGTLEFLGRTDDQVKVRGHRIELGEVESALVAFGSVVSAVVLAVGDPLRLVAFVVPGEGADVDGLADFLGERLPSYAVPSVCVVLDELPLTVNGKVDRRVLVGLVDEDGPVVEGEPVRGEVEERVAAIWVELLGVAEVRRDDNFIALGGDSLLATRLVEAIRQNFGVEIPMRQIFAAPTVAQTAELIDSFEEGVL